MLINTWPRYPSPHFALICDCPDHIADAVRWACDEWARDTVLRFDGGHPITVRWQHDGCEFPFGPDKAHSFYRGMPHEGEIHLNADCDWSDEEQTRYTLLHEIGHVLGLPHLHQHDSIMRPYPPFVARLRGLDRSLIDRMYAARLTPPVASIPR